MAIDIIGTLYEQTGTDSDDMPIMQPLEGFHVNTIDETIDGAYAFIVPQPSSPSRLYAGREVSDHTFYRFENEAQFRGFVPVPDDDYE